MSEKEDKKTAELFPLEELAKEFCKESWELRAIKILMGWATARPCTKEEFLAAQKSFWSAKMG